jgi:hypothetical protein
LGDEIKYEQVFTFGEKSCNRSWVKRTGKQRALGPSKALVPVSNPSNTTKTGCDILQNNDDELDSIDVKKRRVYHIPQQVHTQMFGLTDFS